MAKELHNTMTEDRFITSVTVTPANVTDDKEASSLYEQQEKKPETVTGDGLSSVLICIDIYIQSRIPKSIYTTITPVWHGR